jgi:large subunit ribosomal protein L7/L12
MSEEATLSPKTQEIIETIGGLTVLELAELVKALEEKFGVSAAAPVMVAGAVGGGGGGDVEEEVKDSFDVVLTSAGEKKIQVIKVVREITSLGLKEAKALVDEAPKPVKEGVTKEEADEIQTKLSDAGGTVEIQ